MRTPIARIYLALIGHFKYLEEVSVYHGGPVIDTAADDGESEDPADKIRKLMKRMMTSGRDS